MQCYVDFCVGLIVNIDVLTEYDYTTMCTNRLRECSVNTWTNLSLDDHTFLSWKS